MSIFLNALYIASAFFALVMIVYSYINAKNNTAKIKSYKIRMASRRKEFEDKSKKLHYR